MSRCACGTGTCSCIVKAAPDGGVTVVGNGSATRPYLISVPGGNPLLNLDVLDSPTLDLSISGAGTPGDKRILTGQATQSLTNLKDVVGTPTEGEIPVWRTNHWEFEAAAAAGLPVSGSWGTAPLDRFGPDSLQGRQIYLDVNSQLRSKPDTIQPNTGLYTDTTGIDVYPVGTSVMSVSSAEGATWPYGGSCTVVTHRRADTATGGQWCYANSSNVNRAWYRNGNSALWSPWVQVGGLFSDSKAATALTSLTTNAVTDIAGMTLSVPVPGPSAKYLVIATFDAACMVVGTGTFVGGIVAGGNSYVPTAILNSGGSGVTFRATVSQTVLVTGLAAATHVFKGTGLCSAANQWKVNATHSTINVAQIA